MMTKRKAGLPSVVRAASRLTNSGDDRTRELAWRLVNIYVSSAEARAMFTDADYEDFNPHLTHAELMRWIARADTARSACGTRH